VAARHVLGFDRNWTSRAVTAERIKARVGLFHLGVLDAERLVADVADLVDRETAGWSHGVRSSRDAGPRHDPDPGSAPTAGARREVGPGPGPDAAPGHDAGSGPNSAPEAGSAPNSAPEAGSGEHTSPA
jgi:hypothetical protein